MDELFKLSTPNLPLFSIPATEPLTKINQLKNQLNQIQRKSNDLKVENNNSQQDLSEFSNQTQTINDLRQHY
ncbi:hypothetical protein [endosymbiont GvMRE of Glomus versiforme]|uniref:hypothetical protein n=1 Tax=endosymbiont GvMRE of Glomus versiforme TaxID=2039283 RepID=UPI0011C35447|nr:hypothetical protein [endosymbiont GvMRE of Glomus versiforme]